MATELEIAWAAGLFEGEGNIRIHKTENNVAICLGMTDEDAVNTFQRVVGAGTINPRNRAVKSWQPHWKTNYVWFASSAPDVQRILTAFLPWLQSRRKETALLALEKLSRNQGKAAERTHCKHGHLFDEANTYLRKDGHGRRHCRTCHRETELKRYYARKAAAVNG